MILVNESFYVGFTVTFTFEGKEQFKNCANLLLEYFMSVSTVKRMLNCVPVSEGKILKECVVKSNI